MIPLEERGKRPAYSVLPRDGATDKPKWDEYQKRLPTPAELEHWFADTAFNVGIVCGRVSGGLVVVDFDSIEAFDWWCNQDYSRWMMPTVKTGKGRHVYVRVSSPVSNRSFISRKIDFRGEGGYVVAPPSLHESGEYYRWMMGTWAVTPTIESMSEIGLSDNELVPKRKQPDIHRWDRAGLARNGMPMSISSFVALGTHQGNRDRKAFWSACECQKAGVPAGQAVDWITSGLERSNPDRDPREWAEEKVRSAYSQPRK